MIRKQIVVGLLCLSAAAGFAQTVTHQVVASQFNNWKAYPQSGPYSNTNLIAGANVVSVNPCNYAAGGSNSIPVFAASTPIRVVDNGTPSLSETITPTSITNGGCTATLTTGNAHTGPFYFQSGTFGLQEAINANSLSGGLNTVIVDSTWHAAGGGFSTITNAAGNINLGIVDSSLAPASTFRWNGSHYLSSYSYNTGSITLAAGAAAGTSPTITPVTGNTANTWTVTVLTGSAPTTGTLFTATFGTAFPTGGANCVVQSVGANFGPAITVAQTSTTVTTVSVTVAPAAATTYIYNGTCN